MLKRILGIIAMTLLATLAVATPALAQQGSTMSQDSADTTDSAVGCTWTWVRFTYPIYTQCGTKVLDADWNGDGHIEESVYIETGTRVVKHVEPGRPPRQLTNGKADNLIAAIARPSSKRVEAYVAGSGKWCTSYSYVVAGGWVNWYRC
jgi:hypothetical protein